MSVAGNSALNLLHNLLVFELNSHGNLNSFHGETISKNNRVIDQILPLSAVIEDWGHENDGQYNR